ncbi:hypothetical protein [Rathayibacter iranicus]|nr:hypothetical protein [Rathayibacter iranicus]MWV31851.1 hypothetical protein [Rathayibacter iranicus NCPPB 2253 = VKM Ac-1602]PWJ62889.1 ribulose-phosphate 3-epimerase [Rathayibacter iranicus NCPPB 2253 = VKM Ac-1602]
MTRRLRLSISVLCVDQTRLEQELTKIAALGVDRVHIDVIDPSYGNVGLPPELISDLQARLTMPVDVHVMLAEPEHLLPLILDRRPAALCLHQCSLTPRAISMAKSAAESGVEVGLVLDGDERAEPWVVDAVEPQRLTVMSVVPGGVGRPFRPEAVNTVRAAASWVGRSSVRRVEVDGAISPERVTSLLDAGADSFVLGSSVFPVREAFPNRLAELWAAVEDRPEKENRQ